MRTETWGDCWAADAENILGDRHLSGIYSMCIYFCLICLKSVVIIAKLVVQCLLVSRLE
jgi:hypothetical protein